MKLSIVFVSSFICLSMVAAKKHGFRRVLRNQRKLDDIDYEISCEDIFDHLDTSGDGTLTYEETVESLTQWGATDDEIAYMLEGFGPGDSVPKAGFIEGCESPEYEKKGKVQKIKLAYAQSKAKKKQSFWKKAATNHDLDGSDDEVTCTDAAAYIDTNGDESLSYEEGEAFAVEIGFTAEEFAAGAAEAGYGPGDSVSTADWIGLCENDFVETKKNEKKALFGAAEKVQKIERAIAQSKTKKKQSFWKKAATNHDLDGGDDEVTCTDVAAYIDTNGDESLSYEEGEAFAVEIGSTAEEYAAAIAEAGYGPGDSVSTADWIGLCESYFVETKKNKKKALFGAAEKVQKIERAHAREKKEKKTLRKKAATNHDLDGSDDEVTCADIADYVDANDDGSISYEEGEAFAVEIGITADEYAAGAAEEGFGPGDSISLDDATAMCESAE